jgi:hypothetical protein
MKTWCVLRVVNSFDVVRSRWTKAKPGAAAQSACIAVAARRTISWTSTSLPRSELINSTNREMHRFMGSAADVDASSGSKRPSNGNNVEQRQFGMECGLLVGRPGKIAMTLRALFAKEVYIRLAEDDNTFLCTVQRGPFRSRPTEVPVEETPMCLSGPDDEPCSVRRGIFRRMGVVAQSQRPRR